MMDLTDELVRNEVVYVVRHSYELNEGEDETKLIGVFSSRSSAQAAVAQLLVQPGFEDRPNDFHIDEYIINEPHWTGGFAVADLDDDDQDSSLRP